MSENTLPAGQQPSLADVIKKIRNTDFPYAVNAKWEEYSDDKHKKKDAQLTFINTNFTPEERSVLLNASAQDLFDALINTQPQTIDWSFDNPYIKWPLVASLCATGAACIASPCIAAPLTIAQDTADVLTVLGATSCLSSLPFCQHQSNIQEYEDHGIDADRTHTKKKDKILDKHERKNPFVDFRKYRGRTLKDYAKNKKTIFPNHFIRIIKDLSQYRIHNIADQKAVLHILTEMKKLQYTPPTQEDIKANGYDKSPADINNNESKTQLKNENKLIK